MPSTTKIPAITPQTTPAAMRTARGVSSVGCATNSPMPADEDQHTSQEGQDDPDHPTQLPKRTMTATRMKHRTGANGAEIAVPRDSRS